MARALFSRGLLFGALTALLSSAAHATYIGIDSSILSVNEGDGSVNVTVTRSGLDSTAASVTLSTGGSGDTATASLDYQSKTVTLSWLPNEESTRTVSIPIIDDTDVEGTESFSVQLTSSDPYAVLTSTYASVSITDNDETIIQEPGFGSVIGFSAASFQGSELGGVAHVVLTRTSADSSPVSVMLMTSDGSAVAGSDYVATTTTVSWGANEGGSKTVAITLLNDAITEGTETFQVALGSVYGGQLDSTKSSATVMITESLLGSLDGLSDEEESAFEALEMACSEPTSADGSPEHEALEESCLTFAGLPAADKRRTLESMLPRQVGSQGESAGQIQDGNFRTLRKRTAQLRVGATGVNLNGLATRINGESAPLAALLEQWLRGQGGSAGDGGLLDERVGVFVTGEITMGEQDASRQESGFDLDVLGLTVGADYRLDDQTTLGLALGFSQSETEYHGNQGEQETDAFTLSAYGNRYLGETLYLDWMVAYSSLDFTTERTIVLGATQSDAIGETSGSQWGLGVGLGFDESLGAWQYGGFARLDWVDTSINSYTEEGGLGLALAIDTQRVRSAQSTLGGKLGYVLSSRRGVWIPSLEAEWIHEFKNDDRLIRAVMAQNPAAAGFAIRTDEEDSDFFRAGFSLVGVFTEGRSAFFRWESELGRSGYRGDRFELGYRQAF